MHFDETGSLTLTLTLTLRGINLTSRGDPPLVPNPLDHLSNRLFTSFPYLCGRVGVDPSSHALDGASQDTLGPSSQPDDSLPRGSLLGDPPQCMGSVGPILLSLSPVEILRQLRASRRRPLTQTCPLGPPSPTQPVSLRSRGLPVASVPTSVNPVPQSLLVDSSSRLVDSRAQFNLTATPTAINVPTTSTDSTTSDPYAASARPPRVHQPPPIRTRTHQPPPTRTRTFFRRPSVTDAPIPPTRTPRLSDTTGPTTRPTSAKLVVQTPSAAQTRARTLLGRSSSATDALPSATDAPTSVVHAPDATGSSDPVTRISDGFPCVSGSSPGPSHFLGTRPLPPSRPHLRTVGGRGDLNA